MKGKHIVFVSTHNLATNPRLVKEIRLALMNKFSVTVINFEYNNWSKEQNDLLLNVLRGHINYLPIRVSSKSLKWVIASVSNIIAVFLNKYLRGSLRLLANSIDKRSIMIQHKLNCIEKEVDLIVGHNPGSFYPVYQFAKIKGIPFGIDIEDYHPGETNNEYDHLKMTQLFSRIFSKASYLTYAAPLIKEEVYKKLGDFNGLSAVVLNLFPIGEFDSDYIPNKGPLKLVWFSQHIDKGRGLEELFLAFSGLSFPAELHLIGQLNEDFFENCIKGYDHIYIHKPLPQSMLHQEILYYDVGLALENAESNLNRDICLTNKIFTFLQSGLFVLASDTKAQKELMKSFPENGLLSKIDPVSLREAFYHINDQLKSLRDNFSIRKNILKEINWETESIKILKIWLNILK